MHQSDNTSKYNDTPETHTSPESDNRTRKCIEFAIFFLLSYGVALVVIYTLLNLFWK